MWEIMSSRSTDAALLVDDQDTGPQGSVVLEARGAGKRYPGVIALDDVSISMRRGEIHALLGENGAGKSTLIGILSGITEPDSGEIIIDATPIKFSNAAQSQSVGITTIHQEQTLAPDLTVLENIFLGRELRRGSLLGRFLLDERAMRKRVEHLVEEFGLTAEDLRRPAGTLGALKQHAAQILKALAFDARVVILDEPTSGLADHERMSLFENMRRLRDRGVAILWVTHRLDELFGLADVITVLRDGRNVATVDPGTQTPDSLVRLMVGRRRSAVADNSSQARGTRWSGPEEEILRLESVSRAPLVRDVDLVVKRGEILGIAGIAGAGRTELARIILGADRADKGQISVNGKQVRIRNPRDAYNLGIAIVPEERKTQAVLGDFSLAKNISISDLSRVTRAGMIIDRSAERKLANVYVRDLEVKTSGIQQKIRNLSGGNQQKVVIARCLFTRPALMIFDEPTQGIDVAAKNEVYRLIYEFVDAGGGAIVISSELPELLRVSDRIVVMREGRVAGEVAAGPAQSEDERSDRAEVIMALAVRSSS
ncbi:MAG: ribose transport system ATP-binding protein [Pseudonocardiales bacterium]|jgi:ribose transport system ATP-binding protein|nr:ribose transport system ATP-binding protein [Pseudonocardiales bacterium]